MNMVMSISWDLHHALITSYSIHGMAKVEIVGYLCDTMAKGNSELKQAPSLGLMKPFECQ